VGGTTWFDIHVSDDQPTSPGTSGDEPEDKGAPDPHATEVTPAVDPDATKVSDPDATRISDPDATQLSDADATKMIDPDATRALAKPEDGPTRIIRPQAPDPTAVIPSTPPTQTWRGSAGVHSGTQDPDGTRMWGDPTSPGRAWWLPIVLGIVGLLIIVGVAFALVAAMKGSSTPAPPLPVPSSTPIISAPPTTPSAVASTPPSPTPSLTSEPPASVTIPDTLTGLLFPDVEAELNSLGLKYTLVAQADATERPNTVLSTNPAAGTVVPYGSTVTIVYAVVPPSPSASPSASATPTPTQ
jgi:PASTA domain